VYINTQELPMIPTCGVNQPFDGDNLKDVMLFATPPESLHEMDRMGFDPNHHDSVPLLLFMENCEATELLNNAVPGNVAPG
jgi:hypothetical protein